MNDFPSNKTAFAGLLAAIVASACCIVPVIALVAGFSVFASGFSWLQPLRPYLIGLTLGMLSFAWYKKLKTQKQVSCDCDDDKNPSFFKSKVFLSLVTLFSILMLAFPYYAWAFYPDTPEPTATLEQSTRPNQSSITKEIFSVHGMTCAGCEQHLENEVKKLDGIIVVKADYEHGKARVSFDATRLSKKQIIKAINSIGYKVKKKDGKHEN